MPIPSQVRALSVAPLLATALLLTPATTEANTVTFVSSRDNTLYEDAEGDTSNGAGDNFFAGRTLLGSNRRGLVRFSVGDSIPRGSTVSSASLTLHMSRSISGPLPVNIHRALKDWGEAGSDAPLEEGGGTTAQAGDATWLHTFFNTNLWTAPGGDFAATASVSQMVDSIVGCYTWASTAGLVADVQRWVTFPDSNFGWVVRVAAPGGGTSKRFDSKEDTIPAFRPMLTVDCSPPVSGVPGSTGGEPAAVTLEANVPNPFGARTTLAYSLERAGAVRLSIFDAAGRRLVTLVDGVQPAGRHLVVWDGREANGREAASGVYVTRLESAGETRTRAIHLMR